MSELIDFREEMRETSNFDLQEIIKTYPEGNKGRVIAALQELERRGALYSEDRKLLESLTVSGRPSLNINTESLPGTPMRLFRDPNVTDDINAPKLYSRFAIRFFAILFSTFFGGVLMAINLKRLEKKRELIYVIVFSSLFSYLVFYASSLYPDKTTLITLVLNLTGAWVLEEFFWKRHIGTDRKYRKQSMTGALLIGFGITLFLLMVYVSAV